MPLYTYRPARPKDIQHNWNLFTPDRPLYPPDLWNILPRLWTSLLEAQRVQAVVVEDERGRAQLIGAAGFVEQRTLTQALSQDAPVCETLFRAASRGKIPFLTNQQVAAENAKGGLIQFTFTGTPAVDLKPGQVSEQDGLLLQACMRAYCWHLEGFRLQSLYAEWASVKGVHLFAAGGFRCVREHPLRDGGRAYLVRFDSDDARMNPGAGVSRYFWTPEPVLGLKRSEQQLLEHALAGGSDAEIAELLGITPDGLKKRWRRVYAAVDRSEPALAPPGAPQTRRKVLLDAIRSRPEELRPYKKPAALAASGSAK